jgi:hypothetical protein
VYVTSPLAAMLAAAALMQLSDLLRKKLSHSYPAKQTGC